MGIRVLIVDDQPAFRAAAREVVAATDGFEVVGEVESGEESVLATRSLRPDLVLMDIQMPGVDGLDATRRVQSERSEVVVFLLSTYDRDDFGSRIDTSGADAFIPKATFGPDTLAALWKSVDHGRRLG
jgi:DNA-binding NarL/FixJ family response regulator